MTNQEKERKEKKIEKENEKIFQQKGLGIYIFF